MARPKKNTKSAAPADAEPPDDVSNAEAEDMPPTDPEHGDLTPEWAAWFYRKNGAVETRARYVDRIELLPADLQEQLSA